MSTLTIPWTFTDGTTIEATEHNANFTAIKNFCEALSAGTNIDSGAIGTAALANNAVTAAKIASATITSSQMAADSVGTTQIADSSVTLAKLASAVQALLVPAGTVVATVNSAADTGWLLLNGQAVANAQTLYPSLWAVSPSSWKSGSTLNLPNAANKMIEGAGTTALGATGGSNTVTIASGNLPTHTHSLSSHTHTLSHTHQVNPPNTSVSISDPGHFHGPNGQYYFVTQIYNGAATNYASATDIYSAPYYGSNSQVTDTKTTGITASVDIGEFTSGGASSSTSSGPSTADTGNGGFANTAMTVTNAHVALNFQIKAH